MQGFACSRSSRVTVIAVVWRWHAKMAHLPLGGIEDSTDAAEAVALARKVQARIAAG